MDASTPEFIFFLSNAAGAALNLLLKITPWLKAGFEKLKPGHKVSVVFGLTALGAIAFVLIGPGDWFSGFVALFGSLTGTAVAHSYTRKL